MDKSKKIVDKDKKIKELEDALKILNDRIFADQIVISKLSEEYQIASMSYLDDIKRLMLRLGGVVRIDPVTSASAMQDNLTLNINYEKDGHIIYTLVKEKSSNEKE
jgi:hypothetical protein